MVRLQPCPSCGRHIRVSDRACPFCLVGFAPAPARLSVALLGLCLVACASGCDTPNADGGKAPAKTDEAKPDEAKPDEAKPPEVTTAAPTTAIEPPVEPPDADEDAEPEVETTAAPEPANDSVGTNDGSTIADEPEVEKPVPKPKYGAPRPAKKYGAPPKPPAPGDEPW